MWLNLQKSYDLRRTGASAAAQRHELLRLCALDAHALPAAGAGDAVLVGEPCAGAGSGGACAAVCHIAVSLGRADVAAVAVRGASPDRGLTADQGASAGTVSLGVTGGAAFGVLQYVGLQYTSALNVSLLNSLTGARCGLAPST